MQWEIKDLGKSGGGGNKDEERALTLGRTPRYITSVLAESSAGYFPWRPRKMDTPGTKSMPPAKDNTPLTFLGVHDTSLTCLASSSGEQPWHAWPCPVPPSSKQRPSVVVEGTALPVAPSRNARTSRFVRSRVSHLYKLDQNRARTDGRST